MAARRTLALLAALVALVAAACGGSSYRFVANKEECVYLKVPQDWQEVPRDALLPLYAQGQGEPSAVGFALLKQVLWERAWDSSSQPAVGHFVLGAADAPVLRVNVRTLLPEERDAVSTEALRSLLIGPYQQQVEGFRQLIRNPGTSELVSAEFIPRNEVEVARHGFRGVRQEFEALTDEGARYVVGFIALVDEDRTKLATATVHCNQRCFNENQRLIDSVLDSFTARKP